MHLHSVAVFSLIVALSTFVLRIPEGGDAKPKDIQIEAVKKELKRLAGTWDLIFKGTNGGQFDHRQLERLTGQKFQLTILEDGKIEIKKNERSQY